VNFLEPFVGDPWFWPNNPKGVLTFLEGVNEVFGGILGKAGFQPFFPVCTGYPY